MKNTAELQNVSFSHLHLKCKNVFIFIYRMYALRVDRIRHWIVECGDAKWHQCGTNDLNEWEKANQGRGRNCKENPNYIDSINGAHKKYIVCTLISSWISFVHLHLWFDKITNHLDLSCIELFVTCVKSYNQIACTKNAEQPKNLCTFEMNNHCRNDDERMKQSPSFEEKNTPILCRL